MIYTVTDATGCTQNAVKNVTIHHRVEVAENAGSPTLQPTPGDPTQAMLLAYGSVHSGGTFTMTATLTGTGSCSINGPVPLLEATFGFTVNGSIAVSASESYPITGTPGDEWGLYGQILHQHHTGTATWWNCNGTPSNSAWTADQFYGPGAFVAKITP